MMTKQHARALRNEISRRVREWTTWDSTATDQDFYLLLDQIEKEASDIERGILAVLRYGKICTSLGVNLAQSVQLALLIVGGWHLGGLNPDGSIDVERDLTRE